MPRPHRPRRIMQGLGGRVYHPLGSPPGRTERVVLTLDQLEAIRLADVEGLYQDAAADRMGVSRATFGRIIAEARRVVGDALVNGKAIEIAGGVVDESPSLPPQGGHGRGWGRRRRFHGGDGRPRG
ncbi:MAG: DUF134 domain-containing protein [Candidatus Eisenbacteria bacterium]|nr:DUF134 domain-containing protein [Candidatus Eisenbacteria bacterium]